MKIDDLLNKYFEGETTCEEEQWIRHYFSEKEVPEHLLCYKPMFAYFDKEINAEQAKKESFLPKRKLIYTWSGIAACALIAVAVSTFVRSSGESGTRNYVVINGKRYTDEATVKAYAGASFQEVATSRDEVLMELFKD